MKNLFLFCAAAIVACLGVVTSNALEISIGSISVRAGQVAAVDVTFANAPTNSISAFALYLASSGTFGIPRVSAAQSNVTLFVDDFGNGVYRLTGLVLNGPGIGNGVVGRLDFSIPANANPATYPVAIALMPGIAPPGTNPETRALGTSEALANTATEGSITVLSGVAMPPVIASIARTNNGSVLTIQGEPGVGYRIEASTNLANWTPIFSTNTMSNSFEFADIAANQPLRFYRVVTY
jgi:hypothetical protein